MTNDNLFSLQSFPNSESDAGLVQGLVGVQGHPQLIPDPQEQQASLDAVDGALPDQLVEALRVQLPPDLTNAGFASLPLYKLLVQLFLCDE